MSNKSIVICNKNAKILLARQFVKMNFMELNELVVQFTRNIESSKESTHIETDTDLYVFIPIDTLYLVIISNRNTNIIESIEIIKLVFRHIQDICKGGK
jgi:precorrin-3B methylase